ncbi:MAG TPA: hypothetical protein PLW65_00490 [Pseudomonadota bacterium]|nr:hypothetical protein [Pseudomonadota bacterium]
MRLPAVFLCSMLLWMTAAPGRAEEEDKAAAETSLPLNKGLPVAVRTGLHILEVKSFDENEGTFQATTDLRLTWTDLRLRYSPGQSIDS